LNRESGSTIVLITHEPDIAMHANRIIHIRDGKLVEDKINPHPTKARTDIPEKI
jgi:ABC-type lipoprotein export system ATPase subunit